MSGCFVTTASILFNNALSCKISSITKDVTGLSSKSPTRSDNSTRMAGLKSLAVSGLEFPEFEGIDIYWGYNELLNKEVFDQQTVNREQIPKHS